MIVATLCISLLVLMFIGVPIAISLGLSSMIVLNQQGVPLIALAQSVFESLNSFSLMAVPFFILAGNLMQSGGIAQRLINLANALFGWVRGGLGGVVVLTSMFFSTMSGSSSATTAAVGSILIPAMEKKGYPRPFAAAVAASSGELGSLIPPSITMIVYALSVNVSVASVFLGGILPGLLVGISLIICTCVLAWLRDYDMIEPVSFRQWLIGVLVALKQSFFALLMPVVILGGIYTGAFTPTEASVVAVIYGLIIGLFIYREMNWHDLLDVLGRSAIISAIVLIIVAFASIFAYMLTVNRVPHMLGALITDISDNPLIFLMIVNLFLFGVGMFIEALAAIIILAPILAPIAVQLGIDPIHFAIVMIINLAVGMATPPVGVNLFVVCQVANVNMEQLMRPMLIFLGVLMVDVLIVTYVPILSTWFLP
jgi:C4-dicarboxylate transporter DctM subunit